MKKVHWRVYSITEEGELEKALGRYELATGEKPVIAQVSERAPEELVAWVERSGLEVIREKGILPRDVWLTHEAEVIAAVRKEQQQLPLFGEVE